MHFTSMDESPGLALGLFPPTPTPTHDLSCIPPCGLWILVLVPAAVGERAGGWGAGEAKLKVCSLSLGEARLAPRR